MSNSDIDNEGILGSVNQSRRNSSHHIGGNSAREPFLSANVIKSINESLAEQVRKLQPNATRAGRQKRCFSLDELFIFSFLLLSYWFVGYYSTYPFFDAGKGGYDVYSFLTSMFATTYGTFGYNMLLNGYFTYTNLKAGYETIRYRPESFKKLSNWVKSSSALVLSTASSAPFAGLSIKEQLGMLFVVAAYVGYTALHYSGAIAFVNLVSKYCCDKRCQDSYDDTVDYLKEEVKNNIEAIKKPLKQNWDAYEFVQQPTNALIDQINDLHQPRQVADRSKCEKALFGIFTSVLIGFAGWGGPISYLFSTKDAVDDLGGDFSEAADWALTVTAFVAFAALVARVLCVDIGTKFFDNLKEIATQPTCRDVCSKLSQKTVGDVETESKFDWEQAGRACANTVAFLPSYYSAGSAFYLFKGTALSVFNKPPFTYMVITNAMLFNGYPAPVVVNSFIDSCKYYFGRRDTRDSKTVEFVCKEFQAKIDLLKSNEFVDMIKEYPELLAPQARQVYQQPETAKLLELDERYLGESKFGDRVTDNLTDHVERQDYSSNQGLRWIENFADNLKEEKSKRQASKEGCVQMFKRWLGCGSRQNGASETQSFLNGQNIKQQGVENSDGLLNGTPQAQENGPSEQLAYRPFG